VQVSPTVPRIEMPTLPPAYQAVATPVESADHLAPVPPAFMPTSEGLLSSRDKLIAKAKAFKESQDLKQKHEHPQQLSMNVDPAEQQSLEEARRIAREVLSSPFANQNLEVPAYIRKRQAMDNQER